MGPTPWKAFDDAPVSHSVAHHLAAIARLCETRGYARVSDVARTLEITRGAASLMIKGLRARGLVEVDDQRFLRLSAQAQQIVAQVRSKRQLVEHLLRDTLGVAPSVAAADACKVEHLLSDETARQLCMFQAFLNAGHPAATAFLRAWCRRRRTTTQASNPPLTVAAWVKRVALKS